MLAARLHAPLAGMLLCLFALSGCEQPQPPPSTAPESRHPREPAPLPEPPATPPPATEPEAASVPAEPPAEKPDLESLVLVPQVTPFTETPAHSFGEVPTAEWLAAPARRPMTSKLLPDLFDEPGNQGRVNVEGELLLDGSQGTSGMLDGIGMKIEISTN